MSVFNRCVDGEKVFGAYWVPVAADGSVPPGLVYVEPEEGGGVGLSCGPSKPLQLR